MPDDNNNYNPLFGQVANPLTGVNTNPLSNPMLLGNMLMGAGANLYQGPSTIPVGRSQALLGALLGANQGYNNTLNAYAQLPMYQAQMQSAQADAALKQAQVPPAAYQSALAMAKLNALAGNNPQSGSQGPAVGATPNGAPQGGAPISTTGSNVPGIPAATGAPQNNNTSTLTKTPTPLDMKSALSIASGNTAPPSSSTDLYRLASVFDFMGDKGNSDLFKGMADKYQDQESKGFIFDPTSNSWVINPLTTANMSRAANIQALSTSTGNAGANYNPLTNTTTPVPGYRQNVAANAGAVSGAQTAATTANGPANPVTIMMPGGQTVTLDKNRQADQVDAAIKAGGQPYDQMTPPQQAYWATDKQIRDTAQQAAPQVARQLQTFSIAKQVMNDPNLSTGQWQQLSMPARSFLASVGVTDPTTTNTQQALDNITSRLMFQESPTLSIKTIRAGMLPYMEAVQGSVGSNPGSLKAAMLVGQQVAQWEQSRIQTVTNAPDAVKAETDWEKANKGVTPEFSAAFSDTLHSKGFQSPHYDNVNDFMGFYNQYKDFLTPQQMQAAQTVVKNFQMGKNLTGTTIPVGQ